MSEDKELQVMSSMYAAIEPLEIEAKKRVMLWLMQKLAIEPADRPSGQKGLFAPPLESGLQLSTDTIATVIAAKSGPDLIIAAAAHLHFVEKKLKFGRQDLIEQMRSAPGHFKETFVNNLSSYLTGLTRADRLRLVATGTYALSVTERQNLEAKLANA